MYSVQCTLVCYLFGIRTGVGHLEGDVVVFYEIDEQGEAPRTALPMLPR